MAKEDLLLLNLNMKKDVVSQICEVLISSFNLKIQVNEEFSEKATDFVESEKVSFLLSQEKIVLIVLFLPRELLLIADSLLRFSHSTQKPVVVITDSDDANELFSLLKQGATDFITLPVNPCDILPRIWRILDYAEAQKNLTHKLKEKIGLKRLIGESPAFLAEVKKFPMIAKCDACVLISGETGTGKEMCASAIHYLSPRADKPFLPVNCGAIPLELVENELFGHERGAYTGASLTHKGLIQEADGGTLFLDEVDSLPLLAQVKLLRFLQNKEYRPLGSTKTYRADVRVIAASNSDLAAAVNAGQLRRDLYYRLNVVSLNLPPLRERPEDIVLLIQYFIKKYSIEFDKNTKGISQEALRQIQLYDLPGNVRELENIIERAVLLCESDVLQSTDIVLPNSQTEELSDSFQSAKAKAIERFEKSYIQQLLLAHQGNITRAAKAAHKNRRAFWELIRKYGIDVRRFKPESAY